MAYPDPTLIVPEIELSDDPTEAERTLFENFKMLRDFFLTGATGTFTAGANTVTVTKGLITDIS